MNLENLNFALEEISWDKIAGEVSVANQEFAEMLNGFTTTQKLSVFKASYPYGAKILEKSIFNLPLKNGKTVPITSHLVPEALRQRLSYNIMPVCLILEKKCEVYSDFDSHFTSFQVLSVGETTGAWEINEEAMFRINSRNYRCCDITAGTRTAIMFPKITVNTQHNKLRSKYHFRLPPPTYFFYHYDVFKKIAQHPNFTEKWQCVVLFFPKEWLEKSTDLNLWNAINYYLLRDAWRQSIKWRINHSISLMWQFMEPEILKMKNEPRHYIVDTVKRLLLIGLGGYPAFAPATTSTALPLQGLQQAYIEDYKLDGYIPTIMESQHIKYGKENEPLYYSLQCPTLIEYSFALTRSKSAMQDLEEIKQLMDILLNKLKIEKSYPFDVIEHLKFDYYHTDKSCANEIRLSNALVEEDPRFNYLAIPNSNLVFASKASFARGCIKITYTNN